MQQRRQLSKPGFRKEIGLFFRLLSGPSAASSRAAPGLRLERKT